MKIIFTIGLLLFITTQTFAQNLTDTDIEAINFYVSNNPPKENERLVNEMYLLFEQLKNISEGFKQKTPNAILVHVIDRGEDDQNVFDYIDQELEDKFVIRLKLNRNSEVKTWSEEKGKEVAVKIAQKTIDTNFKQECKVFSWRGKSYKNAKAEISYDHFYLGKNRYYVVRIQMYDSGGRKIFENPMLIASNLEVTNAETALRVFHIYLKRSKIEGVF